MCDCSPLGAKSIGVITHTPSATVLLFSLTHPHSRSSPLPSLPTPQCPLPFFSPSLYSSSTPILLPSPLPLPRSSPLPPNISTPFPPPPLHPPIPTSIPSLPVHHDSLEIMEDALFRGALDLGSFPAISTDTKSCGSSVAYTNNKGGHVNK